MTRRWWITVAALAVLAAPACTDSGGGGQDGMDSGAGLETGEVAETGEVVGDVTVGQDIPDEGDDTAAVETGDDPIIDDPDTPIVIEPDEVKEDQPLTLSSIEPDKGSASGGEQVELVGTGFEGNLQVFFDESPALDTFVLDTERMVAITPPRIPGLVDVRLINPDTGESTTLESGYLFFNPVGVVSIDPPNGHVLGGEPVTITGSGFVDGAQVLIGGRSAIDVEVIDDTTIYAITPDASSAGTFDVHVSSESGVGLLDDGFTYFETPAVASVTPIVGPIAGGNVVQVKGAGFVEPLVVTFGAAYLEDVEVLSGTVLQGTVPGVVEEGAVDVLVATSYGSGVGVDAYTYLADLEPGNDVEILAITPTAGPAAGGQLVTVVARGLTTEADTTVYFGAQEATIQAVDAAGHVVLLEVPAGDVGSVAVTLNNSNGTDTRANGYVYENFVKVYSVGPNFGPTDGGTEITVKGVGFVDGLQLRVGALPAATVTVVDSETITATTPPGSPGLANVTVLQGSLSDTLVGGFAYLSDMNLWVVDPAQGSQAGGTWIELAGSGFPEDATVLVGGSPATHVTVVSPTKITARTPPGNIGSVDVTVTSISKGAVVLPNGYTYFDPESVFGGTWGNEVDGAVNVTVLSGADGSGIPDAFVMLWTDPTTPYQGYTNQQGQITFSGPELSGEQMVSASKPGFASNSVVEYDAQNITLYLVPTTPPSPGTPPPGAPPPIFNGQVVNATKYVPVPWGQCSTKFDAPGTLCDPCTTAAECGGTMNCSEIPMQTGSQTTFCTSHCVNNDDCVDGFMCMPLNGVEEPQCVPASGVVTAYCDFTKGTIFSQDFIPNPGQQVLPDFSFQMTVPVGEFAMYCWGGIEDPAIPNSFVPYALGLKRHVFALPGDVIDEKIVLNHPLNGEMTIRLDDPPSNVDGPNYNFAIIHIDLGSDGVFEMLDHPQGYSDTLTMPRIMKGLTGDLYDASYTIFAGAFSVEDSMLSVPYSVTLHTEITQTVDDTFFVYDANGWEAKSTGITKNINGLVAKNADAVLGVGSDGLIVHSVGSAWAQQESGTENHLYGVDALETNESIAVGQQGVATHFDGFAWTVQSTPTGWDLQDVWMASPTDAFAVGYYVVLRWDGLQWVQMSGNTSKNLRGVYGFGPDDVWAVGNTGNIIHWDGVMWNTVPSGTVINLRDVWGPDPDNVYIVGEGGVVLHWDGAEIKPMPTEMPATTFEAIHGAASDDFTVVGSKGTILRWDGTQWLDESPVYNNSLLAVASAGGEVVTAGTHELLLGPLLQVPENISPSDGGTMNEEYRISWDVKPGPDPHFSYVVVSVPGMMGPVPEWIVVNDFNVTENLLPDFPNIEGTPGISVGPKILTLWRVYKEGFDIDNYSYQDFGQLRWRSWAVDETTFTKL